MKTYNKNFILLGLFSFSLLFVSCMSKETQKLVESVKFISEKQAEDCEYIGEVFFEVQQSALGEVQTENEAKKYLRLKAAQAGGNALRITDRKRIDKKGKYSHAKLILYGDCYKCKEKK